MSGAASTRAPGDRLPGAELPGEQPAFRVADRCRDHGSEEQQIRPAEATEATALDSGEADSGDSAERGEHPEGTGRALAHAYHDRHRGGCGQQCDHHGTVACRCIGQSKGGEHREADDDTAGDDCKAAPLGCRGQRLPCEREGESGENCREHGTTCTDEYRGVAAEGDPREWHGEGEGEDAQKPPGDPGWHR